MTAHAMDRDREMSFEAGMDDFVPKPIQPQDIIEAMKRQLLA